jgi:hypothetical protein
MKKIVVLNVDVLAKDCYHLRIHEEQTIGTEMSQPVKFLQFFASSFYDKMYCPEIFTVVPP